MWHYTLKNSGRYQFDYTIVLHTPPGRDPGLGHDK